MDDPIMTRATCGGFSLKIKPCKKTSTDTMHSISPSTAINSLNEQPCKPAVQGPSSNQAFSDFIIDAKTSDATTNQEPLLSSRKSVSPKISHNKPQPPGLIHKYEEKYFHASNKTSAATEKMKSRYLASLRSKIPLIDFQD